MSQLDRNVVDLDHFRGGKENRVLAGRDIGEEVRRRLRLDDVDKGDVVVEVKVPSDLFSVTSSFFLGLFGESIRRLGAGKFREHYRFTGKRIDRVIEDAIRSVSLTSPLR